MREGPSRELISCMGPHRYGALAHVQMNAEIGGAKQGK